MELRERLHRWLGSLVGSWKMGGRARQAGGRGPVRLEFECLEARTVPTVLFTPVFGAEPVIAGPVNSALRSPPVHLLFWGTHWSTQQGQQDKAAFQSAAQNILGSSYLTGLVQYGSDGQATFGASTVAGAGDSPPQNFTDADLQNFIQRTIDGNSGIPAPAAPTTPIYVVITGPNDVSADPNFTAFNKLMDFTQGGATTKIHMAWIAYSTLDGSTSTFSQELAEAMLYDTNGAGTTVRPALRFPASLRAGSGRQIGDNEPDGFYDYRINGTLVAPYWSRKDRAFLVADGTQQKFVLTPIWEGDQFSGTYTLTVSGDQLVSKDDAITIDSNSEGGLLVNLNGETAAFDPAYIVSVRVLAGNDNDSILLERTLITPVTVNAGLGNDIVSIAASTQNLDQVLEPLVIVGSFGIDTLDINDQANTADSTYTLTSSSVKRGDSGTASYSGIERLTINGGSGSNTYNVQRTANGIITNLNTGGGNDIVNVLGTGAAGTLNVQGQGGQNAVNLGNPANSRALMGRVNITNPLGSNTITLDDTADLLQQIPHGFAVGRASVLSTFTPAGDSAWGQIAGQARAPISYRYTETTSVTVKLGKSGRDTLTVWATGVPTNLVGGFNAVLVGRAGSVLGITGPLNIEPTIGSRNRISVNAIKDSAAQSAALSSFTAADSSLWGALSGLAPAAINYRYLNTKALVITRNSQTTIDVQSTGGVPTIINGKLVS